MSDPVVEQHEETYGRIVRFYDFAEELINTVEHEAVSDPENQLAFIEPLVHQLEDAADVLAEEYRNLVRNGTKPNRNSRQRIEKALAQIYTVMDTCKRVTK
jgi:hypothetical protein